MDTEEREYLMLQAIALEHMARVYARLNAHKAVAMSIHHLLHIMLALKQS